MIRNIHVQFTIYKNNYKQGVLLKNNKIYEKGKNRNYIEETCHYSNNNKKKKPFLFNYSRLKNAYECINTQHQISYEYYEFPHSNSPPLN